MQRIFRFIRLEETAFHDATRNASYEMLPDGVRSARIIGESSCARHMTSVPSGRVPLPAPTFRTVRTLALRYLN